MIQVKEVNMAGQGSGNWWRWDAKSTTDSQDSIDIRLLKEQNCLLPGYSGSLSWSMRGKTTGPIGYNIKENSIILNYKHRSQSGEWEDVEQVISFDRTPCNYGGSRKWFLCPRCFKRVAVLYGAGKYFFCRHCYNLTYESCNICDLQRIFNKAYKLKKKLGGQAGLHKPIPDRPKGMHRSTYIRMVVEIDRLEEFGHQCIFEQFGMRL